jgi:hypothetical protein
MMFAYLKLWAKVRELKIKKGEFRMLFSVLDIFF